MKTQKEKELECLNIAKQFINKLSKKDPTQKQKFQTKLEQLEKYISENRKI